MDSFYGGIPGSSDVIKAVFSSEEEMHTAFQHGPEYTKVWYGDLCLITTPNLNDSTNGNVYRRSVNYSSKENNAIFVGKLAGPMSGLPNAQIVSLADLKVQAKKLVNTKEIEQEYNGRIHHSYPVNGTDSTGFTGVKYNDYPYEIDPNTHEDKPNTQDIREFQFAVDKGLVAGGEEEPNSDKEGVYRDTVKYSWIMDRTPNKNEESRLSLGMELPYLVESFVAKPLRNWEKPASVEINANDNKKHPFFQKWELGIPAGKDGWLIKNIQIVQPISQDITYYKFKNQSLQDLQTLHEENALLLSKCIEQVPVSEKQRLIQNNVKYYTTTIIDTNVAELSEYNVLIAPCREINKLLYNEKNNTISATYTDKLEPELLGPVASGLMIGALVTEDDLGPGETIGMFLSKNSTSNSPYIQGCLSTTNSPNKILVFTQKTTDPNTQQITMHAQYYAAEFVQTNEQMVDEYKWIPLSELSLGMPKDIILLEPNQADKDLQWSSLVMNGLVCETTAQQTNMIINNLSDPWDTDSVQVIGG